MKPSSLALKTWVIVMVLASLLTACGGSDDSDDVFADDPSSTAMPEPSPDPGSGTPDPTPTPDPTMSPDPTMTPVPTMTPEPQAAPMPITLRATDIGNTLVASASVNVLVQNGNDVQTQFLNKNGMTLYVWDQDSVRDSNCNGGCIAVWPPLVADTNAMAVPPFSVIERDDGTNQWALRDMPIYFYVSDTAPGDINGEGVNSWHVALSQPTAVDTFMDAQGDYLVAYGNVSVAVTDGGNTQFVAQRQDKTGFALYTFDTDPAGQSVCNDSCAAVWPPLLADSGDNASEPYSLISRQMDQNGGTALQWAYHGKPLYFYAGDANAGETSGRSLTNWTLSRPQPWKVMGGSLFASGRTEVADFVSNAEQIGARNKDGYALYVWGNDTPNQTSSCTGSCLAAWPALMAHEGAEALAPYSLIPRAATGELQWALNGMPLYFYIDDIARGQTNGDGVGAWSLASP